MTLLTVLGLMYPTQNLIYYIIHKLVLEWAANIKINSFKMSLSWTMQVHSMKFHLMLINIMHKKTNQLIASHRLLTLTVYKNIHSI